MRKLLAVSFVVSAVSCSSPTNGTSLLVDVTWTSGWPIVQLRFSGAQGSTPAFPDSLRPDDAGTVLSSPQSVIVLLKDSLDGEMLTVNVEGLTADSGVFATGTASPTAEAGQQVTVDVALTQGGTGGARRPQAEGRPQRAAAAQEAASAAPAVDQAAEARAPMQAAARARRGAAWQARRRARWARTSSPRRATSSSSCRAPLALRVLSRTSTEGPVARTRSVSRNHLPTTATPCERTPAHPRDAGAALIPRAATANTAASATVATAAPRRTAAAAAWAARRASPASR